ncbi:hypothetical protein LCGC14_1218470 [marine sediment metagenome]|uniref:Uncharacterized protein n=1 Tax=marine sediment metagenome TaxID=412755 RepID=A0A0F9LZA3_9ZZZZ
MIKITPRASNSITIEIQNGGQFQISTNGESLTIQAGKGDMVISKYDLGEMEWQTAMNEHIIRIGKG